MKRIVFLITAILIYLAIPQRTVAYVVASNIEYNDSSALYKSWGARETTRIEIKTGETGILPYGIFSIPFMQSSTYKDGEKKKPKSPYDREKGHFFLRPELSNTLGLSIGYGKYWQIYLNMGAGIMGGFLREPLGDFFDNWDISYLNGYINDGAFHGIFSVNTSIGVRWFGHKRKNGWGRAIDTRVGLVYSDARVFGESIWSDYEFNYDSYSWVQRDIITDWGVELYFTLPFVYSYKNWDFALGLHCVGEIGGGLKYVMPVINIGINSFDNSDRLIVRTWTPRESYIYPTIDSYDKPCATHIKTKFYTESQIKGNIIEINDGIVGIYEDAVENGYKLGVIKEGGIYKIVHMSGGNNCWYFGDLKATLRESATQGLFKATWYLSNYSTNNSCIVSFNGATMTVILPSEKNIYIKMYPTNETSNRSTYESNKWSGTGWALGNGYIVTNYHVAEDARTISIKGVNGDLNTGYTAEVVATDKVNDIAVLRITDSRFGGFDAIPYSVNSRMADVGEDVFVLGYPLTQALGNEIKLTNGIISSRTGYQGNVACYQMSAPVQPGNSGGPMFDNKGNVIGIVVAGVPGAENVGYAIKTSYLKNLIESAGLNISFSNNSIISSLSLTEKVKQVKRFVFYIECSK